MKPTATDTLGTDILRGVEEIAEFIGEKNHKKVYYWLCRGFLPAGKLAGQWTASRAALRAHYAGLTSGGAAERTTAPGRQGRHPLRRRRA